MERPRQSRKWLFFAVSVALFVSAWQAMSAENGIVSPVIRDNALLRTIYEQDPERAVALASEAETDLAALRRDNSDIRGPRLKFRGGTETATPDPIPESDILRRNRKDFDENPILKDIYYRSPLASLRMLKRLREASENN